MEYSWGARLLSGCLAAFVLSLANGGTVYAEDTVQPDPQIAKTGIDSPEPASIEVELLMESIATPGTVEPAVDGPIDDAGGVGHPVYDLRPEPFDDSGTRGLTLAELLDLAVANNFGIQRQGFSIESSHYSVDQTYYAYDPKLSGSLSVNRSNPGASTGSGTGSTGSTTYSTSATYAVPREYGDSFSASYNLSHGTYSGGTTAIPDSYGSGFSLNYNRPLGQGAGKYLNLIPRYLASNSLELSYEQLDDNIRKLKKNVTDTFYLAVAAREAISLREASLERSLKQLERSVERYKVGLAIQAEVLQAENSVLSQRSQLLTARNNYSSLLDALVTLTSVPGEYSISVDTKEALTVVVDPDLPEDLWGLVRDNSIDLKSLRTQLANQRLSRDQIADRLKPQVNLGVNYNRSGSDDEFGAAVGGLEDESYGLQVNWSLSPGERSTKASLAQADLDLANLELSIQDTELQLKSSLRSMQRGLTTKYQQIEIAESNLTVLNQTYEIMVERNNVGLATTLDVIEAQEDVLSAELGLLNAKVDYQQAYREILLAAGLI